jgi:hypothetical protein
MAPVPAQCWPVTALSLETFANIRASVNYRKFMHSDPPAATT